MYSYDLNIDTGQGGTGDFLLDTRTAYLHRSGAELKAALRLFRFMQHPRLVRAGSKLAIWALRSGMPVKGLIRSTLFRHFCGGENLSEALYLMRLLGRDAVLAVLDYAAEGQDNEESFDHVRNTIIDNIHLSAANKDIRLISVKVTGLASFALLEKLAAGHTLTDAEAGAWQRVQDRMDDIAHAAWQYGVTIYIDAEESWIQAPVDDLAHALMRKYNTQKAVVFNTYQMYRKDRLEVIWHILEEAKQGGFAAGIKIVRGAYLEKETARATAIGYPVPVYSQKEDTDHNFNAALRLCLGNADCMELCVATHNEESTRLGLKLIHFYESGVKEKVQFSQLYGMCDHLTYNLARHGYTASKYLPYGRVEIAMPYLLRRAEENTSVGTQVNRDLRLLEQELRRRQKEGSLL